jgi:hypothetical protein
MPRLAPDDPKRIRGSTASLDYWARIRRHKRPGEAPPPEWPANVHPISQEALSLLGLDEHEHLYWDGKPLEIRKRLDLTTGERVFAIIVSGVVMAATVASAYATWQQSYIAAKALSFERAKHAIEATRSISASSRTLDHPLHR